MSEKCWQGLCSLVTGLLVLGAVLVGQPRPATAAPRLQVMAASSLTEAGTELKAIFEKTHKGVIVNTQFAASSMLRTQIENGAKPDIFMSADEKNIKALAQAGLLAGPYLPIAHNSIAIIVPKDNPERIRSAADLARPGLTLVGCSPEIPVGNYTQQVLDKLDKSGKFGANYKSRVQKNFRSLEPNVKGIVAKVTLGDAEAGFCYASDVTPEIAKQVKMITIPAQYNVKVTSYIGVVKNRGDAKLARQFVDFVRSAAGQKILKQHNMIPIK
jgi:molybdate transport system substrate-binding protein